MSQPGEGYLILIIFINRDFKTNIEAESCALAARGCVDLVQVPLLGLWL